MKEKQNNNNMLFIVIVLLLIIIAVLGFFLWKNMWNSGNGWVNSGSVIAKDLEITVIDDKRCVDCQTEQVISQLQQVPSLADANFEIKDFSEAEDTLKNSWIAYVPAIIFSHNNVEGELKQYLVKLDSWEYSLQVWASFDPFIERSERWFLILDKDELTKIKENSYIKWNPDAKITWVEYSDLECPYCAQLHNNWTPKDLEEKYGEDLNIAFNHFPLDFHANAMPWAKILECVWELNGTEKFYELIEVVFEEEKSSKSFIKEKAEEMWVNIDNLEKCIDEDKYEDKIKTQTQTWNKLFGITWTPGNILINNETGEYQIISWAYPTETFIWAIDRLLWK